MSTQTDTSSFHVHDIMEMLAENNHTLDLQQMINLIVEKFGSMARFSSCSMKDMNVHQTVDFLVSRQKLIEVSPGKFSFNSQARCKH